MSALSDQRQYAPATQRNRVPILQVLSDWLPPSGTILEISSGSGEHAVYFAQQRPDWEWLPSDINPIALASINAWRAATGVTNLLPSLQLDVEAQVWPVEAPPDPGVQHQKHPWSIQAMVNINMIHISPWSACLGLFAGAGRILPPGGILYLYGPFQQKDVPTAPSNVAFDAQLRSRNPAWGIRNLETVITAAQAQGFNCIKTLPMPANNLSVILRAESPAHQSIVGEPTA